MSVIDEVIERHPEIEEATFTFKKFRKGVFQYQAVTPSKIFEVTFLPHAFMVLNKEECVERLFQADDEAVVSYSLVLGGKDASRS